MTLFTLTIFVIGIWLLSFYASRKLHEDMERQLGEHQLSTASLLATHVNDALRERLDVLEKIAEKITPIALSDTSALQALLEDQLVIQRDFNAGAFVTMLDGIAITSVPPSIKRIGVNYMERDYIAAALREGKSKISQPVVGKVLRSPVFSIAVPIRDTQGKVIGALAGVVDLGKPNFLDKVTENHYGKSGYYLLEDPKNRVIITGTDKRRVMQQLPAPGVNPLIDRHVQGYEETGITVNPLGVEVLASAKRIPLADWFIVAALPTAEAFAPIHDLEQRILLTTVLLTLVAGGMSWWMLRRELSPMFATLKKLAVLAMSDQHPQPLPIVSQNEIGDLIGGFNHLLEVLGKREAALKESEFRWKFAIEGSGDGLWDWDLTTSTVFFSKTWKNMLGYSEDEIGNGLDEWQKRIHPDDKASALAAVQNHLDGKTPTYLNEHRVLCKDGSYKWILDRGLIVRRSVDNKPLRMIGTHSDITERKQAENILRESKVFVQGILDSVSSQIAVIDSSGVVTAVNESWRLFSIENSLDHIHPAQHTEVGSNYLEICNSIKKEGSSDAITARKGIQAVLEGRLHTFQMEYTCHAPNEQRWFMMAVTPLGMGLRGAVIVHTDISDRKLAEEKIRNMAYRDTLTKLPNRRLLIDRMSQAIAASKRSGCYGALMFLDLDNFKPLNDMHGHVAGDLLLIEVAHRLRSCVRETDTVARFGGDEFVVMLAQLEEDREMSKSQAEMVAEKIRSALSEPYLLKVSYEGASDTTVEHHCTASIGVVLFIGDEASQDDIMKWADEAMYQAKDAGRNQVRFYQASASVAV